MNTSKINRVEVIDHTKESENFDSRVFSFWDARIPQKVEVELVLQDNDRTLKVFIRDKKINV